MNRQHEMHSGILVCNEQELGGGEEDKDRKIGNRKMWVRHNSLYIPAIKFPVSFISPS